MIPTLNLRARQGILACFAAGVALAMVPGCGGGGGDADQGVQATEPPAVIEGEAKMKEFMESQAASQGQ